MKRLPILLLLSCSPGAADDFHPVLENTSRPWIGPEFWSNPMEDWRLAGGKAENVFSGGDRDLVPLTVEMVEAKGDFEIAATFEPKGKPGGEGFAGFQIGLRGDFHDYRDSAIYGTGFCAGVDGRGRLFIGGTRAEKGMDQPFAKPLEMKLTGMPNDDGSYRLTLAAGGSELVQPKVHASWMAGLVSFTASSKAPNRARVMAARPDTVPGIAQARGGGWRFAMSGFRVAGTKVKIRPGRAFGPILWTQHTLENNGCLNLSAQMAPIATPARATLLLDGKPAAEAPVDPRSRAAVFHVQGVDTGREHAYEVRLGDSTFAGRVRREPADRRTLTVASMSCNDSTGFPHTLLVGNVMGQRPDVVAFLGDQIYEPIGGYGIVLGANNTSYDDRTMLCYLRKYYMHGWAWRDLLRDTPSVTIPDDHDVFHGNLWGAGGKLADRSRGVGAPAQDGGGHTMSAGFVNAVIQTQAGNLPPPANPAPCGAGIHVWFTAWDYAGIDMAILADRQFKSAPKALLPESRIENGWPQNHAKQRPALTTPRELDVPGAELLGPRQEAFLARWADEKPPGARWRLVFSATPLMALQSIPEDMFADNVVPNLKRPKPGEYPPNDIPKLDYDSNGWPQSKRDLAAGLIFRAHALHVTGDQHLGSTGQYGVAGFGDSAWWISSPAIANLWPRRWFPKDGGANRRPGDPKFTGEFEDGFGNRITLHAVANPYDIDREPSRLFDKAVGYSILTLDRDSGRITLANWPYYASPAAAAPDNKPYPGWPITIDPATQRRVD